MHRNKHLPQLDGDLFLTDGGIETVLIYREGIDLPYFAAFVLLSTESGRETLGRYYRGFADIAVRSGMGFVFESATWRASPDWAALLGYSREELADLNRGAVALVDDIRHEYAGVGIAMPISGCVGPRRDGYAPDTAMTEAESQAYHGEQIAVFAETAVDQVTAITMTNVPEAIGVARAAENAGLPCVISFTVETDGKLPTGESIGEAILAVDGATGHAPAYYMVNCAHPTHFDHVLAGGEPWLERLGGIRANASCMSHAELDEATELDAGDPDDLAARYSALRRQLPNLTVMGGCCGTDHPHISAIADALEPQRMRRAAGAMK